MKSFIYLLLALALFGLINISNADAQVKKTDNDDSFESMFGYGSPDFSGSKINADAPSLFGSLTDANVHSNVIPLEGKINPEKYIVGPNDLFTLGVYGFINQQVPLYVSPEGTVIIPTVGEVMVSDLTLAEARSRVIATVKKKVLFKRRQLYTYNAQDVYCKSIRINSGKFRSNIYNEDFRPCETDILRYNQCIQIHL